MPRVPENYSDVHRLLVQIFVSEGILEAHQAEERWGKALDVTGEDENGNHGRTSLQDAIRVVNKGLREADMEIASGKAADDGTAYYALVNTRSDSVALHATSLDSHEIDYFKRVLDMIFRESEGTYEVSSTEAQNAASDVPDTQSKKLTKKEAEDLLKKLYNEGWLRDSLGRYSLGMRSVLELKTYINDEYNDCNLGSCDVCKETIITPHYESCSSPTCNLVLHKFCSEAVFQNQNADNKKCPSCRTAWESRAIGGMVGAPRAKPRRASAHRNGRRDEDDEEEEENDGDDFEATPGKAGPSQVPMETQDQDSDDEEIVVKRRKSGRKV